MEVRFASGFFKSFKRNIIDIDKPWKWAFQEDRYYRIKRAIKSLISYFRITTEMVPWDYHSILKMMKFQVGVLSNYLEKHGLEVEEDRLPKIEKMKRFIELANHHIEDDYADRCGYNYDYGFKFVPVEEKPDLTQLVSAAPPEVEENNTRAIKESHELEEKEWNEMIELLKDMRGWWD